MQVVLTHVTIKSSHRRSTSVVLRWNVKPGFAAKIMRILWKELRSIDEADKDFRVLFPQKSLQDVRRSVRIVVIDDKDFSPLQNLQQHQFSITHLRDLSTIDTIRDYPVVLVDLQGVGRELNPRQQGAHLIREIKANFPEKYVIAYTGGAAPDLLVPSIEVADRFTQKDTSIEDWCELLDEGTLAVIHPAVVWRKNRTRLLDKGVTPFQLACLEDTLVRSLLANPSAISTNLELMSAKLKLSSDIRTIVNSMISNALFSLIV